jgi:hypothetical protein
MIQCIINSKFNQEQIHDKSCRQAVSREFADNINELIGVISKREVDAKACFDKQFGLD